MVLYSFLIMKMQGIFRKNKFGLIGSIEGSNYLRHLAKIREMLCRCRVAYGG